MFKPKCLPSGGGADGVNCDVEGVECDLVLHSTPASSAWEQSLISSPLLGQSNISSSEPLHRRLSSMISPLPCPKRASPNTATGSLQLGLHGHVLLIEHFSENFIFANSRMKDIFATFRICDQGMICRHQ